MKLRSPGIWAFTAGAIAAGVLIWVNVRTRFAVSESPSSFGMPWSVRVHVARGWPCRYYDMNVTGEREGLVRAVNTSAGRLEMLAYLREEWPDRGPHWSRVVGNVGVAAAIMLVAAMAGWWAGRRLERCLRAFRVEDEEPNQRMDGER